MREAKQGGELQLSEQNVNNLKDYEALTKITNEELKNAKESLHSDFNDVGPNTARYLIATTKAYTEALAKQQQENN